MILRFSDKSNLLYLTSLFLMLASCRAASQNQFLEAEDDQISSEIIGEADECYEEAKEAGLDRKFSEVVSDPAFDEMKNFTKRTHDEKLADFRDERNGLILTKFVCPTTEKVRKGNFCLWTSPFHKGGIHFANGCTSGPESLKSFFFDACIVHDNCYHHADGEEMTQQKCNSMFKRLMYEKCETIKEKRKLCRSAADGFYWAVEKFGSGSWNCSRKQVFSWHPEGFDTSGFEE